MCPVDCFTKARTCSSFTRTNASIAGSVRSECPVDAIKPATEPGLEKWLSLNAEYAKIWPNITIKKAPRRTLRSGRGSRTNSNTSRQFPARVIEVESGRPVDEVWAYYHAGRAVRRHLLRN